MKCGEAGKETFSFWSLIGVYVSHVLLGKILPLLNLSLYRNISSNIDTKSAWSDLSQQSLGYMRNLF